MVDVVSIVANGSDDTAAIAARMRNALEEFSSGPVTHRALERFGATRPNLLQRMRFWHECSEPGRTALLISSYASVKLYDLVFESSRPVFADSRPSDAPRGTSLILERPDAAGLTVDLWVPTSIAPRVLFEHRRAPLAVLRDNDAWMGRRPPGDHN
jgi:hypothetical protein